MKEHSERQLHSAHSLQGKAGFGPDLSRTGGESCGEQGTGLHHSEEVEAVMGQTPPWIFRWGITIISLIVAVLLASTWFFHWPDTLTANGQIYLQQAGGKWADMVVHLQAIQVRTLQEGMAARVVLDVKGEEWGCYHGTVMPLPVRPDSTGSYPVHIRLDAKACTDEGRPALNNIVRTGDQQQYLSPTLILDATAIITLSDQRLLQRIIRK